MAAPLCVSHRLTSDVRNPTLWSGVPRVVVIPALITAPSLTRLTAHPVSGLLYPGFLTPYGIGNFLRLLNRSLPGGNLFLHHWRLLDPDLLLHHRNADLFILIDPSIRGPARYRMPLNHDFFPGDRHVDGLLLLDHFLA